MSLWSVVSCDKCHRATLPAENDSDASDNAKRQGWTQRKVKPGDNWQGKGQSQLARAGFKGWACPGCGGTCCRTIVPAPPIKGVCGNCLRDPCRCIPKGPHAPFANQAVCNCVAGQSYPKDYHASDCPVSPLFGKKANPTGDADPDGQCGHSSAHEPSSSEAGGKA